MREREANEETTHRVRGECAPRQPRFTIKQERKTVTGPSAENCTESDGGERCKHVYRVIQLLRERRVPDRIDDFTLRTTFAVETNFHRASPVSVTAASDTFGFHFAGHRAFW